MRIRIVDAFTSQPFSGAPAGVVLLDAFPDDAWMQRVAAEVNHAETAFLHPITSNTEISDQAPDWALRWFTPAVEVALCGHATLAAAHVLAHRESPVRDVRFATRSGILTATTSADGLITLDFPTAPLTSVEPSPALAAALGAEVKAVHHTGADTDDLLVELADEETVRAVTPDLRALVPLSNRGVIVTAAAAGEGYDFVSRFFGPAVGVDEDPVTGSAHTALAPYWAARLGRTELTGYQASRRGGHVRVALRGDRTELAGHAVTVIDGTLTA
ncbi:oxidoreductase [Actinoplanes sp. OR16]|uniref:PhzF family phenazine biosynthesis protein n=1 Tax=Actinoplanes sp. OR16 TaxID=946334 RepID=UPI000F6C1220|nr:PhzF family phenazine biosynthesis protein [Actinoplanes sp. OR16]BBH64518.1 oxidoreductase [Actinoplanes sp. OR16]